MGLIDGTTELGGGSTASGALTEPEWAPSRFEAYQLKDVLDLRAYYADGTTNTVLRLLSNLEAHFYGELILHDGAIRSFNTMSIACITNDEDIVSFRAGDNTGEQVARIDSLGSYTIFGDGGAGAALSASGLLFNLDFTITGLTGTGGGATPRSGTLEVSELTINATDATDLVTFNTGATPTQVARIGADGSFGVYDSGLKASVAKTGFHHYGASTTEVFLGASDLIFRNDFSISGITSGGALRKCTIEASQIVLRALDAGAGLNRQWGYLGFTSAVRDLRIINESSVYKPLTLYAETIAIGATSTTEIASFYQGTPAGTKMALIGNDGAYGVFSGGTISAKLSAAELRFYAPFIIKGLTGTTSQSASVEVADLDLRVFTGSAMERWGKFSTASAVRKLTISESTTAKSFTIEADDFTFRDSGASADWGKLYVDGGISHLRSYDDLTITSQGTGTAPDYRNILLVGCNISLLAACEDGIVEILDSGSAARFQFTQKAAAKMTSPSGYSALISMDTSGAKKWELRSDKDDDELKFVNQTDGGTPTVRITPAGSVYAPGYVGPITVGGRPANGAGELGAIAIDPTHQRIWVKIATEGETYNWWFAALTEPDA